MDLLLPLSSYICIDIQYLESCIVDLICEISDLEIPFRMSQNLQYDSNWRAFGKYLQQTKGMDCFVFELYKVRITRICVAYMSSKQNTRLLFRRCTRQIAFKFSTSLA